MRGSDTFLEATPIPVVVEVAPRRNSVAMQFDLTELPGGVVTLPSTETRIGIGDPHTAHAFAPC